MSHKKIKESDLAKTGLSKCPVPGCGRPFRLEEDQKGTPANPPKRAAVCPPCWEFAVKLLFWLPRIQIKVGQTPGGLVVPGSPGFNMVNKNELPKQSIAPLLRKP